MNDDSTSSIEGWVIPLTEAHVHRRLLERYGLVLEHGEFSTILRIIRKGYAPKIAEDKKGGVYAVRLPGRAGIFLFVANVKAGFLVTVLPPGTFIQVEGRWIRARDPYIGGRYVRLDTGETRSSTRPPSSGKRRKRKAIP